MPTARQSLVKRLSRMYPLYSGCGTLANSSLMRIMGGPGNGQTWCEVTGGEVWADLSDYVGRSAFFFGDLDRKITWICERLVRNGDTVLDIGANIGLVTVLLSRLVGPSGKVYAFEPNPNLVEVLKKTKERNRADNVQIHEVALGETAGELPLIVPPGNAGAASLLPNRVSRTSSVHRVGVARLDDIVNSQGIGTIRLIKIDVEGFERMVFKGAPQVLGKLRPDAILFELNDRSMASFEDEPLIRLLKDFDYQFIAVPKCLVRMRLRRVTETTPEKLLGHDFLAAPKGNTYESVATLVSASA